MRDPSSPEPFTVHQCACGVPCKWCVNAEQLRVRNPLPNARPDAKPKQCRGPHQCVPCFEQHAARLIADGDPSVIVFECGRK